MSDTLYLIAHKVRGAPAFDIAIQMEVEDEVWWIIPTSGHRAYPYYHVELDLLGEEYNHAIRPGEMPSDLPDHYTVTASKAETKSGGQSLLASLGLGKPKTHPAIIGTLKRRI